MSFCSCPHCCPPGVSGLSPLPVPGGQMPPSSGVPQQQLPPAPHMRDPAQYEQRSDRGPPLPPPNAAAAVPVQQRISSSGGVRTSTRSSSAAAQGQSQDPSGRTHAPMDQEVIDVLLNLH